MRIKLKQDKNTVLNILKSNDIEKKLKLLDRIDGVDSKESIKILMKMLEDQSWCMRERAARKLASYGSRVSSRIERLLKKGYWYTRASACLALGEIGDLRTLEPVIRLFLSDENPTVTKEASGALVKLARKKPAKFADTLRDIDLQPSELRTVLFALERTDIELYSEIKERVVDERRDI
ncbi:MAG: HEAT repeat domain-containing protein [candidate division WOR-3 bacterium]|nr:MAG: HEAT repeat domain-containing protein [candidate division WOR-3 bacterium]